MLPIKVRLHKEGIGLNAPISLSVDFEIIEQEIIAAASAVTGHPYDGAVVSSATDDNGYDRVRYCTFCYNDHGKLISLEFVD